MVLTHILQLEGSTSGRKHIPSEVLSSKPNAGSFSKVSKQEDQRENPPKKQDVGNSLYHQNNYFRGDMRVGGR